MQQYSAQYEKALIPLFEFLATPEKIDFEDDLLLIVTNFIKKNLSVSETIYKIFPTLEKVFFKNQ